MRQTMQAPILITVDDREPRTVMEELQGLPDCHVSVQRLSLGDYQVDERLLFERKTLPDFVASVMDGRMFRQAARLSASQHRGIIILEGIAKDIANHGISREALQGALISVSVIFGIPLLRSLDAAETARLIVHTSKQVRAVQSGAIARKGRRPKAKHRVQLQILQELPGIGPTRAQALLDKYGSVEKVMQARYEELLETANIGKDTAERIRWAVSESLSVYRART
jgi:ERCC4-type nuclease